MVEQIAVVQLATPSAIAAAVAEAKGYRDEAQEAAAGAGAAGKSAYEIAVEQGFVGTEAQWVDSLQPAPDPVFSGTSTTSVSIGTGSKSFTTQAGIKFAVGQYVRASSTSSPASFMAGVISAYDTATGALTVTVDDVAGAGSFTSWSIAPSAPRGTAGTNAQFDYNTVGIYDYFYNGTAWPATRAEVIAIVTALNGGVAYTGRIRFDSVDYPAAAAPPGADRDRWRRRKPVS